MSVLAVGRGSRRRVSGDLGQEGPWRLSPGGRRCRSTPPRLVDPLPSFWDDGWIARSQSNFQYSGGFSTYYTSLGADHLLGYWLDWLQHHLATHTELLVVLRVPSVLRCATWVVCRYVLGRLPTARANSSAPLWAMACALLLMAFGWGLTLRPEPFIALLVAAVTACAMRFVARPLSLSACAGDTAGCAGDRRAPGWAGVDRAATRGRSAGGAVGESGSVERSRDSNLG